jgi:hypothetical protein
MSRRTALSSRADARPRVLLKPAYLVGAYGVRRAADIRQFANGCNGMIQRAIGVFQGARARAGVGGWERRQSNALFVSVADDADDTGAGWRRRNADGSVADLGSSRRSAKELWLQPLGTLQSVEARLLI